MLTLKWHKIKLLQDKKIDDIVSILLKNRKISEDNLEVFYNPKIEDLADPFLFDGMNLSVERILLARENKERVVIFWDYDVDGVSSTAMLSKFFSEIGIEVSYRLPHRVNDWYWLKKHFIDDIASKNVWLLITVDCGTRDIDAIAHAKSLGIDVIITDHHAVPEVIPENVVALINPKLPNSKYPNTNLSGSWVAFKLLQATLLSLSSWAKHSEVEGSFKNISHPELSEGSTISSLNSKRVESEDSSLSFRMTNNLNYENTLKKYIDFAMLGTVADCMPLVGENRVITYLWLEQLRHTHSAGLKRLIEWRNWTNMDADIVWFKIWPKLNAAWRMDSPYKALKVLLASEWNLDEIMDEIEDLNIKRKISTEKFIKKALENIDETKNVIFFDSSEIEHGIIWLIAGRLSEAYNKVAIVLKDEWDRLVASCRSPENISIINALSDLKDMFLLFWWHDGAAGFTISKNKLKEFKIAIEKKIAHLSCNLDTDKFIEIDSIISPDQIDFNLLENIEKLRPFWFGNPKPLFLLKDFKFEAINFLWKDEKHLKFITNLKNIDIKAFSFWPYFHEIKRARNISLIIEIERNIWNGKESISLNVKDMIIN